MTTSDSYVHTSLALADLASHPGSQLMCGQKRAPGINRSCMHSNFVNLQILVHVMWLGAVRDQGGLGTGQGMWC